MQVLACFARGTAEIRVETQRCLPVPGRGTFPGVLSSPEEGTFCMKDGSRKVSRMRSRSAEGWAPKSDSCCVTQLILPTRSPSLRILPRFSPEVAVARLRPSRVPARAGLHATSTMSPPRARRSPAAGARGSALGLGEGVEGGDAVDAGSGQGLGFLRARHAERDPQEAGFSDDGRLWRVPPGEAHPPTTGREGSPPPSNPHREHRAPGRNNPTDKDPKRHHTWVHRSPPAPTWNLVSAKRITRSSAMTGMAHAG